MACAMQFLKKWIQKLKAHNVHAPVDKISWKSAGQMYVKTEFETPTAEKRMKNAGKSMQVLSKSPKWFPSSFQ